MKWASRSWWSLPAAAEGAEQPECAPREFAVDDICEIAKRAQRDISGSWWSDSHRRKRGEDSPDHDLAELDWWRDRGQWAEVCSPPHPGGHAHVAPGEHLDEHLDTGQSSQSSWQPSAAATFRVSDLQVERTKLQIA